MGIIDRFKEARSKTIEEVIEEVKGKTKQSVKETVGSNLPDIIGTGFALYLLIKGINTPVYPSSTTPNITINHYHYK